MTRTKIMVMVALMIGLGSSTASARHFRLNKWVTVRTSVAYGTLSRIGSSINELSRLNARTFGFRYRNGYRHGQWRAPYFRRQKLQNTAQSLKFQLIALQRSIATRPGMFAPIRRPGMTVFKKRAVLGQLGWMLSDLNTILSANQTLNRFQARTTIDRSIGQLQSKLQTLRFIVQRGSWTAWRQPLPQPRYYGNAYR